MANPHGHVRSLDALHGAFGELLMAVIGLARFLEHPLHRRRAEWLGRRWPR